MSTLAPAMAGASVLIKGSRGMGMEAVVEALQGAAPQGGGAAPANVKHCAAVGRAQG